MSFFSKIKRIYCIVQQVVFQITLQRSSISWWCQKHRDVGAALFPFSMGEVWGQGIASKFIDLYFSIFQFNNPYSFLFRKDFLFFLFFCHLLDSDAYKRKFQNSQCLAPMLITLHHFRLDYLDCKTKKDRDIFQ